MPDQHTRCSLKHKKKQQGRQTQSARWNTTQHVQGIHKQTQCEMMAEVTSSEITHAMIQTKQRADGFQTWQIQISLDTCAPTQKSRNSRQHVQCMDEQTQCKWSQQWQNQTHITDRIMIPQRNNTPVKSKNGTFEYRSSNRSNSSTNRCPNTWPPRQHVCDKIPRKKGCRRKWNHAARNKI